MANNKHKKANVRDLYLKSIIRAKSTYEKRFIII